METRYIFIWNICLWDLSFVLRVIIWLGIGFIWWIFVLLLLLWTLIHIKDIIFFGMSYVISFVASIFTVIHVSFVFLEQIQIWVLKCVIFFKLLLLIIVCWFIISCEFDYIFWIRFIFWFWLIFLILNFHGNLLIDVCMINLGVLIIL